MKKPHIFEDNWIYIHDPRVQVGRIQNFKNWSPDMVPDQSKTSLGLEYFCTEGDPVWTTSDGALIEQAKMEIQTIGLVDAADVEDGCVVRVPKAYPVYDADYREYLAQVREFVDGLENAQTIGRNGLHRYNNQDHAMLTGMLAVRNLVLGEHNDLWSVNTDQEYHEEVREAATETHDLEEMLQQVLPEVFVKIDSTALGVSFGVTTGLMLFLATLALVVKGGVTVGPTLALLGQYFPGYSVTPLGSVLALVYGFAVGLGLGWGFAVIRNGATFLYKAAVYRRAERQPLVGVLEYL